LFFLSGGEFGNNRMAEREGGRRGRNHADDAKDEGNGTLYRNACKYQIIRVDEV